MAQAVVHEFEVVEVQVEDGDGQVVSPGPSQRLKNAKSFMAGNNLTFPVVLKPDTGQRGSGVAVVRPLCVPTNR